MTSKSLLIGAAVVVFVLAAAAVAGLAWLWARPGIWPALAASSALCLLVSWPWALVASVAVGDSGPLGLSSGHLARSWWRLAAATSGTPGQFAEVNGALTVACFLLAGWRSRPGRKDGR